MTQGERYMNETERKIKLARLNLYRENIYAIKKLEEEIAELREIQMSARSSANDGMPKGSISNGDLSAYMARIDSLCESIAEKQRKRIRLYNVLTEWISELPDRTERDVLYYRYIRRIRFDVIARMIGYSERQMFRVHRSALDNLSIPNTHEENGERKEE